MRKFFIFAAAWLLLSSCEHKELDYGTATAKVTFLADWSQYRKETPSGMTVMVYPQQGGEAIKHLTNDIGYATLNLPTGIYHSLIFNQSESEFGSVSFRGMESYETAEVYTNVVESRWYKTRADNERVVSSPEWIGASHHEGAEITPEMVNAAGKEKFARTRQSDTGRGVVIAEHTPRNIISTITVSVHIKGYQNLRSVRASLDGLAEGYFLGSGKYSGNTVTQLLENWKGKADETDPTRGILTTTITCFGLPEGHTSTPEENLFSLSLLLADGKTVKEYSFQVGDRFVPDLDTDVDVEVQVGLALELEIEVDETLPDVAPEGGTGSGFDTTVDDWGEEEKIKVEA